VPEHWDVRNLKSLAEIKGGKDSSDVEIDAGGFPIYEVKGGKRRG
jgi:hypothetical protein